MGASSAGASSAGAASAGASSASTSVSGLAPSSAVLVAESGVVIVVGYSITTSYTTEAVRTSIRSKLAPEP